MQPPIDAVLKIVKENDLQPDRVQKIRLGLLRAGSHLIAEPIESKYSPQSIVDAQFSMPFGAAVALLYRKAGLEEFQLSKIRSEKVKRMMRLVECVVDPELDRTFPRQWGATAEILTREGKKYFAKVDYCKGDPENPLSWDELIEKFHALGYRRMTKERRLRVVDEVRRLEKVRDLKKWSSLLLRDR
jgi:2-methylcitrate dehydratase PrpD